MILLTMYSNPNYFEEEGYKISTAEDGPSVGREIEQSPPSLLLDVMMPGMDGFEVTKRIRQDTKLSFIQFTNHCPRPRLVWRTDT